MHELIVDEQHNSGTWRSALTRYQTEDESNALVTRQVYRNNAAL